MADKAAAKPSFLKRAKKFFTETKSEIKKVTWPDRQKLVHNTAVIIAFIIVITLILWVLDTGFSALFSLTTKFIA